MLMEALDEVYQTTMDEYKLKANGLLSALNFLYCLDSWVIDY